MEMQMESMEEEKHNGHHTQFVINNLNVAELITGSHLDLNITNIRSSKPFGFSNIYIHYENIPGYWDGEFILTVEKTPIVHKGFSSEKSVGIGMNPNEKYYLSVGGNLKIEADPDHEDVVSISDKGGDRSYLTIIKTIFERKKEHGKYLLEAFEQDLLKVCFSLSNAIYLLHYSKKLMESVYSIKNLHDTLMIAFQISRGKYYEKLV